MECFVQNPLSKQKQNDLIKIKNNSFFSVKQLLHATISIKINFGLCIAFRLIHYLSTCCPNTFIIELIHVSFNALILILVKLSEIGMPFPFNHFLLVNTDLLPIYLTNVTIMSKFLSLLGTPIWCIWSISSEIYKSIYFFVLFTSSASSFWFSFTTSMRIQLLLEYCSCLPTRDNNLSTFSLNPKTFSSKLFISSFSYSSDLAEANSTRTPLNNSVFVLL